MYVFQIYKSTARLPTERVFQVCTLCRISLIFHPPPAHNTAAETRIPFLCPVAFPCNFVDVKKNIFIDSYLHHGYGHKEATREQCQWYGDRYQVASRWFGSPREILKNRVLTNFKHTLITTFCTNFQDGGLREGIPSTSR